jgi:ubiquinone/menaquinone biosynthesis C-methylase UbiE
MNSPIPFTDATTRFSTKAEVYARARPRYPRTVVTFLEEQGVLRPDSMIADIGVGTGLSAEPFLEAGYQVIGVEPNERMRLEGDAYLKKYSRYRSVIGTAEATTLADASVEVAIAAQAFHWFDIESTRAEMQRILKPGGWFVAMWNHRNHQSSPVQEQYETILRKYCSEYPRLAILYRSPERSAAFFVNGYHDATLPNPGQMSWDLFAARIQSASYIPKETEREYGQMIQEMQQLFEKYAHGGVLRFDLEIWLHWGVLRVP